MAATKLHAGDTPVPVLAPGNGKTKTGRLWVYMRDDRNSGDMTRPSVWFTYTPDRQGIHPQQHLESFNSTLQADAYSGYQAIYEAGRVTEAACCIHYPERGFIRRGTSFRQRATSVPGVRTPHKVERAHKDGRNASRSPFGFHDFAFARSMPAFFQNT